MSLLSYSSLLSLVEEGVINAPVEHISGASIDITIGEDDRADGTVPRPLARMQVAVREDLLPQVGRGVQENEALAVHRHRHAGLGAGPDARITIPRQPTDRAAAVPLRKAATRCGPQDEDAKHGRLRPSCERVRSRPIRSW